MEEWFSFLSKLTLVPFATIAVFEGTRRFSLRHPVSGAAALLALGICVLGGYAGALSWVASGLDRGLETFEGRPIPPIPQASLARMTPQEREERTRLLARIAFRQSGTLTTYSNASGQQVQYAPSEKEIRDREIEGESLVRARAQIGVIRTQVWVYLTAAIAAAVAGLFSRFYGKQTTNRQH